MSADHDDNKPFDTFELCTAILLGLAAIGAAVAGQQAGQWGGKQLDAFGEANTMATKAATQYNEDMVLLNADYAAVAAAKVHILEARDASGSDRERHFEIANYLYSSQLTTIAYQAMELPMEYYVEDEDQPEATTSAAPGAATPAAPAAEPTVEGEDEAAPADGAPETTSTTPSLSKDIPNEALLASLTVELDEDYSDSMLQKGEQMFAAADVRFAQGRVANTNGDEFDLVTVYYTIALFFAGIGLVFKTPIRWKFFTAGTLIFVATSIYIATLSWTS